MTRDDAPRLKRALEALYELYRKPLTRTIMAIWYEALKGYDVEVVSAALSRHCVNPDNGQFLPMPADIVKLIEGGSDDAALMAWAKVDRAVRTVGPYASVAFDDAVVHHAITNMGGWIALNNKNADEWPFVRNQFVTLYRGARLRVFAYPGVLVGIAQAQNETLHWRSVGPTLIGDPERARAVMANGQGAAPRLESARAMLPHKFNEGRAA